MSFIETIIQWINDNPGKTIGICAGMVLGIVIISFGPLKTLFIIILILIGFLIGKIRDDGIPLSESIKQIFRRK